MGVGDNRDASMRLAAFSFPSLPSRADVAPRAGGATRAKGAALRAVSAARVVTPRREVVRLDCGVDKSRAVRPGCGRGADVSRSFLSRNSLVRVRVRVRVRARVRVRVRARVRVTAS